MKEFLKNKFKIIRGFFSLNIATFQNILRIRSTTLSNFMYGAKREYLKFIMDNCGVKIISLGTLSDEKNEDYYLPIHLCRSGSVPWYDLFCLAVLVRVNQPWAIFEIGSYEGLGSLVMCNNCFNQILYSLDLPDSAEHNVILSQFASKHQSINSRYESGKYFRIIRPEVQINQLFGDSWNFVFSSYHDLIDFFFIDGAHTYQYVLKDTISALRCTRAGGMIVWHDVTNSQVLNVILQLTSFCTIFYIDRSNICFTKIDSKPTAALENLRKKIEKYETRNE
ncbi:class I SAM-dependent methyltransferase [candidate division CSSED10-310 bacterium]|uniref:Class I SAM-dependent methyltransferase n=1 Tax=candidate division CSSED10-310 bacterium TaxID=2855610 RepID=A0ABV6YVK9_UNCC1